MLNYKLLNKINIKPIYNINIFLIDRVKYLPLLLLLSFIYYDYKYNAGQLYLLYRYTPIYFILSLYIQISNYLILEKLQLMRILFELYYCAPHIIYVNLTQSEEKVLHNWINHSYFYRETKNEPIYILRDTEAHPIEVFHRFILKHKKNIPLQIKSSVIIIYFIIMKIQKHIFIINI